MGTQVTPDAAQLSTGTPTPAAERRKTGDDRRKTPVDRRTGLERRQQTRAQSGYTGPERRAGKDRRDTTGLERRRGAGVRRTDDRRVAEEGEMNSHQFEFVMAVEAYKRVNKRLYPTWTEILEVVQQLGYRKVLGREVNLESVPQPELWTPAAESAPAPDAPKAAA